MADPWPLTTEGSVAVETSKPESSQIDNATSPHQLYHLGLSCLDQFGSLGETSDLDKAIEKISQAVSLTSDEDPDKPTMLSDLGRSYKTRFENSGEVSDLDMALELGTKAVSLAPDGHPDKPTILSHLGLSYKTKFDHLGEMSDLDMALDWGAQAISLTPDGHPDKPMKLSNLGGSHLARYARLGEVEDLDKAIEHVEQAISLTQDGHPEKARYLNNLGVAYYARFGGLGEIPDLNKAIERGAQAVLLTPDGRPDKLARLNNLGGLYQTRFERLGETSDLSEGIKWLVQAALLTPDGHVAKRAILNNLGGAYLGRFRRLGEIPDLNEAIERGLQAISITPDSHPEKPRYLTNLANSYQHRFKRLGEISDLTKAIEQGIHAVSLTPDGHPDKPRILYNLGNAYRDRFDHLGEMSDLNELIERTAQAVALVPDGHPDRPVSLRSLGHSYRTRFEHLGEVSDIHSALSSYKGAAESNTGSPSEKFHACIQWARLSSYDTTSPPHLPYHRAMELLPQLVWIGTTIGRRYELIVEVDDFAKEAASHPISSDSFETALEWLEAGRSIVWGQIAQLRTPFDQLAAHDPALAEQLREIGHELEQSGARDSSQPLQNYSQDLVEEATAHTELALEWDKLLAEARSIPGLENFLRPPKSSHLLGAARSRPIAIINAHESRCDALVLQPGSSVISHVPLPKFSVGDAFTTRNQLVSAVGLRELVRENRFGFIDSSLNTLWTNVVEPILHLLGYVNKHSVDTLPQITWCTTGLLSFLPLHAAGNHNHPEANTFDRVISSYTPTLSSLLTSQDSPPEAHHGVLAVGQEHTPGLTRLPFTTKELAVVKKYAEVDNYLHLESSEATVEKVLDAMDKFSWIHMACHGTQNVADPTQSAFHLHDGKLTLAAITKQSFTNKGLAFLSACQTATGDKKMPDEAVHLAAGMLMAGYPSVICTMWSIADQDGPEVADRVYAELLKD